MGLGKTVQIVSFLAGLHYTSTLLPSASSGSNSSSSSSSSSSGGGGGGAAGLRFGPALIVCPATIMKQWMREFHTWYPELRILLMHESGGSPAYSRAELVKKVSDNRERRWSQGEE
jgi:DNA excision repair protein ERCC-6